MLKTKEDLKGTFILTQDKELEKKYLTLCEELGVKWVSGRKALEGIGEYRIIGTNTLDLSGMRICSDPRGNRQLTLEDFEDAQEEPENTKVKHRYEKLISDSLSEVVELFKARKLYYNTESSASVDTHEDLINYWLAESLYTCEKIKWQEEVGVLFPWFEYSEQYDSVHLTTGGIISSESFLNAARTALRATGEIE